MKVYRWRGNGPAIIRCRMSTPTYRKLTSLTLILTLAAAACSSDSDEPGADPTTAPSAAAAPATDPPTEPPTQPELIVYEQYRSAPTACGGERPESVTLMTFDGHENQGLDPGSTVSVTIETSCGDLVIELDPSIAPLSVNSFVFLAEQGFYDGVASHRIIDGFMFQIGDQTATGGGDAGYKIPIDEWPAAGFIYNRGVVAMANAGPGTTGSQFFIMMGSSALPPNYTVIGRLVSGDDVLDSIAAIPVAARPGGEQSLPLETLYIESIRIDGDT